LGEYYENMANAMVVTVTEKRSKKEIDTFAAVLKSELETIHF
jgi:glycine cleavage system protein P-like pyridoxal-binding family